MLREHCNDLKSKRAAILGLLAILTLAITFAVSGGNAYALATLTATKTDEIIIDGDTPNVADPGDTIRTPSLSRILATWTPPNELY